MTTAPPCELDRRSTRPWGGVDQPADAVTGIDRGGFGLHVPVTASAFNRAEGAANQAFGEFRLAAAIGPAMDHGPALKLGRRRKRGRGAARTDR